MELDLDSIIIWDTMSSSSLVEGGGGEGECGVKSPDSEESESRYTIERCVKSRVPILLLGGGGGDSGSESVECSDTECYVNKCSDSRSIICLTR